MSRPISNTAFDRDWWLPIEQPPEWLHERISEIEKTSAGNVLDDDTREYLISRARYITRYYREENQERLALLTVADEAMRAQSESAALVILHDAYPRDGVSVDENKKRPSEEARTRATLLYAHFRRLKDKSVKGQRGAWHPYYEDLLKILGAWSVPRDEKKALAQRLILEHPEDSKAEIARHSTKLGGLRFDQSCLSQWIIAGWVLDPYSHLRPDEPLGTRRNRPPKNRAA